jgi:hypothetical protein
MLLKLLTAFAVMRLAAARAPSVPAPMAIGEGTLTPPASIAAVGSKRPPVELAFAREECGQSGYVGNIRYVYIGISTARVCGSECLPPDLTACEAERLTTRDMLEPTGQT